LSPAFYALNDPRTPMMISIASIVVNCITDYYFKKWLTPYGIGHAGLALSTSCVALVNFIALVLLMRRKLGKLEGRRILSSFLRIALASAALSVTSYLTYLWLVQIFGPQGFRAHLIETFVPIAVGGATFVLLAKLLGVKELDQAVKVIGRRFVRS
jgi:putative peptidoglycan lipid II flippase